MFQFSDPSENLLMTFAQSIFLQSKPIGEILQEADLISQHQIELALKAKIEQPHLRIGDILAIRGWLKVETTDFFVRDWSNLIQKPEKDSLGFYLRQAALLNPEEIEIILAEQRKTGIRFGTIAVLQGLLKSTTLDYFLIHLFPEQLSVSPFINMYPTNLKRR